MGYSLSLDKLYESPEHFDYSTYDENFPGLIYKYMVSKSDSTKEKKGNNIVALVFASGKMVFTGAKSK